MNSNLSQYGPVRQGRQEAGVDQNIDFTDAQLLLRPFTLFPLACHDQHSISCSHIQLVAVVNGHVFSLHIPGPGNPATATESAFESTWMGALHFAVSGDRSLNYLTFNGGCRTRVLCCLRKNVECDVSALALGEIIYRG